MVTAHVRWVVVAPIKLWGGCTVVQLVEPAEQLVAEMHAMGSFGLGERGMGAHGRGDGEGGG